MSLKINNLTKSFGEKQLFSDFSFEFKATGIYVIKGESGIGKTTLLRIIAGLDNDYTGTVTDGGISNVSICFQEHRLFPKLSAFDNVFKVSFNKGTDDDKNKTYSLLKRLKFTDTDMTLSPKELSGGMRQRVAFARAVLRNSPILILDEATKELDVELCDEFLDIIREQSKNRLVLMVTHKIGEAEKLNAEIITIT